MRGKRTPILGVDIGGVIIGRGDGGADTSFFGANYLSTPAVDGVIDALAQLRGEGYVIHLVSKCGESVELKSREWLKSRDFHQTTGIPPENLHFCKSRREKAGICTDLSVTHFVDDRLEVLSYLETVPNLYLFNAEESEVRRFAQALPRVVRVSSWLEELLPILKQGILHQETA